MCKPAFTAGHHASDLVATDWPKLFDAHLDTAAIQISLWSGLQMELRTSRSGKFAPKSIPAAAVDTRMRQKVGTLKAHEVDVIRDTEAQLKGKVAASAEAAKLGICRATTYRKLAARKV